MYNRAMSRRECQPFKQRSNAARAIRELALVNGQGDTYRQNKLGQVIDFTYRQNDKSYCFEYSANGEVSSISSSDGWSWTRIRDGWAVRNYFDSWTVSSAECEAVKVTLDGIHAMGKDPSLMGLPMRKH